MKNNYFEFLLDKSLNQLNYAKRFIQLNFMSTNHQIKISGKLFFV